MSWDLTKKFKENGILEQALEMEYYKTHIVEPGRIDSLPPVDKSTEWISPKNKALAINYLFYYPTNLDEIRKLAGISITVADQLQEKLFIQKCGKKVDWSNAKEVDKAAYYLLTMPQVYQEMIDKEDFKKLEQYILKNSEVLPVFLGEGVMIQKGHTLKIEHTAMAFFNYIDLTETSSIHADANTKIIVEFTRHVKLGSAKDELPKATYSSPGAPGLDGMPGVSPDKPQDMNKAANGGKGQDGECSTWGDTKPKDGSRGSDGNNAANGGSGGDGVHGTDGGDGGTLIIDIGEADYITFDYHGGKGGNGGNGGKGADGGKGQEGGNGGTGGSGRGCEYDGSSGNGGNGGKGGNGGHGGNGGNGGRGGNGGTITVLYSGKNPIISPEPEFGLSGGSGGQGGLAGAGGVAGIGGLGGTGKNNGATGDKGEKGENGVNGKNGSNGDAATLYILKNE